MKSVEQVRGDDADDPTTFFVSFDDDVARYVVRASLSFYSWILEGFFIPFRLQFQ